MGSRLMGGGSLWVSWRFFWGSLMGVMGSPSEVVCFRNFRTLELGV